MNYLSATDLNDIQPVGGRDEKRFSPLGLVDAARDSTDFVDYISPSEKEAMSKLSSERNIQSPVIVDQEITVSMTPGFPFIPTNLPTSDQYSYVAVDIFSGMKFWPASYEDNAIDMNWEKQRRLEAITYAMGQKKEELISTVLESRKTQVLDGTTQVSQGDGTFFFNGATDTLEISKAAQKETMFANIQALFEINEIPGMLRYVSNRGGFQVQMTESLKYGTENEKNLQALGLVSPDRYYQTGGLSAGSDVFNGFVFRDGDIGLIENYPWDFRAGINFAGKEWSISDIETKWTRSRLNVFVDNHATDATSLVQSSNMKMTHFQEMGLWDRFYIVYPYNSNLEERSNGVFKIKGVTT